jgi:hypothetical protein
MTLLGLDYVAGPDPATIKAHGFAFVCRYLSEVNALTKVKLLTPAEAKGLSQIGISIVSNYEWYANRALEGFASGVADAQIAKAQHAECGGPPDKPIYFSVDCDTTGEQVAEYFKGVASVLSLSRTGAYGSYKVVKYLLDNDLISYAWQTYAWSSGQWDSRTDIQQYENGVSFAGHSVDYNRAMKEDFGAWQIGETMQLPVGYAGFFTITDDQHIHCKQTNADLVLGHLSYWLQHDGIFRLPLISEFRVATWPAVSFQVYEGAIVAYDPQRQLDHPPTSDACYLVHLDGGPGQAMVAKPLLTALQQQIDDLTAQLAAAKQQDNSALEAQIAAYKQAYAQVETALAPLSK